MRSSNCSYCTSAVTCNGKGVCVKGGTCLCDTGFVGANCEQCFFDGVWPDCTTGLVGSAASTSECETDYVVPVIVSILGTLLLTGALFAAYVYKMRARDLIPDKKQQWKDDFQDDEEDGPTDYNAL
eukprot:TRINITY_DN9506_c0_g1_i2.p2 TRINITY_DN9506_c0_g1~~TRINITY_DN9506_c0_g1_i2.p2  ORF type:complete len:126 (+),score=24.33 TRINITY_DN9506_c0_g1_i2:354-731(+)